METLSESFRSFSGFFSNKDVVIPAIQMVYYVGIINVCMLMQRYRLCFLISLIFASYWMFILNKEKFISLDGTLEGRGYFAAFGVVFVLFASLFCFFTQKTPDKLFSEE